MATEIHLDHSECMSIEDEIFFICVKNDITIVPLKDYIENWFKDSLNKITNPI